MHNIRNFASKQKTSSPHFEHKMYTSLATSSSPVYLMIYTKSIKRYNLEQMK